MATAEVDEGAFKLYMPDEFDIKIWMDENGKYHMNYTEGLKVPKEKLEISIQMTGVALDKMFSSMKGVDEYKINFEVKDKLYAHLEVVGDETSIFSYLVGEFIGRSAFGKASVGQLMMTLLNVPLEQAIAEFAVRDMLGKVVQVIKPQANKTVEEAREEYLKKIKDIQEGKYDKDVVEAGRIGELKGSSEEGEENGE